MSNVDERMVRLLADWREDPVRFVTEAFRSGRPKVDAENPPPVPEIWQSEALRALVEHDKIAVKSGHGVGKALHVDTKVLTPSGWRMMRELRPGDMVFGSDGSPTEVLGVYPQGERELFRVIFDDQVEILADSDHLWATQTAHERKEILPAQVRTTRQIAETIDNQHADEIFFKHMREKRKKRGAGQKSYHQRRRLNHSLPATMPIRHEAVETDVDPYEAGWNKDKEAMGWLRFGSIDQRAKCLRGFVDNPEHVVEPERNPGPYLFSSRGMMVTKDRKGTADASCWPELMDIARSLGCWVRRGAGRLRVYPAPLVPISSRPMAGSYQIPRPNMVHRVEYAGPGPAICIKVAAEDGLFVVDGYKLTHNTTFLSWAILWFALTHQPYKMPCTAPAGATLTSALWPEIGKWHRRLNPALHGMLNLTSSRLELVGSKGGSFAEARTSRVDQPEALQGFHCFVDGTVDVLTDRGWKPLEDVTRQDRVATMDGPDGVLYYDTPLDTPVHDYEGEIVRHKSRMLAFEVTPNHKFLYEKRQCNKLASGLRTVWQWQTRPVSEIPRQTCRIPRLLRNENLDVAAFEVSGGTLYGTDQLPVRYRMDDWLEFLGWYLSEGHIGRTPDGRARSVVISQSPTLNAGNYAQIVSVLRRLGLPCSEGKKGLTVCSTVFAGRLEALCPGVSGTKRVPEFLFSLSPRQIRIFLDAYRLGDGTGDRVWYTSSPGMADDLQRLILLAGGCATIQKHERKGTVPEGLDRPSVRKYDYYRIREFDQRGARAVPVRHDRMERVPYRGKVRCLTMASGLFYVRDRQTRQPFWTHNSDNLMFVIDEASGVPDIVFQVGEGSLSTPGAKVLMTGNPTRVTGYFWDAFNPRPGQRQRWKTMTVSSYDSTRVSREWLEDMKSKYGEHSPIYRIRVLGEFPETDDFALIPRHVVEAAVARSKLVEPVWGPIVWGVDVARQGNDRTAVAKRMGAHLLEPIEAWNGFDLMQSSGKIMRMFDDTVPEQQPKEILIDVIGVGAGLYDRLKEQGLPVTAVNVAERAEERDRYYNRRSELWFRAKDWLSEPTTTLLEDPELEAELVTPHYSILSNGKERVEPKEDTKKRLGENGRSPDLADALVLTFAASTRWQRKGLAAGMPDGILPPQTDHGYDPRRW